MHIYKGREKGGRGRDNGVEARPPEAGLICGDFSRFVSTIRGGGGSFRAWAHRGVGYNSWSSSCLRYYRGIGAKESFFDMAGSIGVYGKCFTQYHADVRCS